MDINHPYHLSIRPDVLQRFPGYKCLVVYMSKIQNNGSSASSEAILRETERSAVARFSGAATRDHSHIAAWREAYRAFGAKPKTHLCSVEALLTRVLKGEQLPSINPVVNVYNAVSIEHVITIGGEDRDRLNGVLELMFASGSELFGTRRSGELVIEHPHPGEVVWGDCGGITCRRWNWRQCERTAVVPATTQGYFVFDCLPPFGIDQATSAAGMLVDLIREFSPDAIAEMAIISTGANTLPRLQSVTSSSAFKGDLT